MNARHCVITRHPMFPKIIPDLHRIEIALRVIHLPLYYFQYLNLYIGHQTHSLIGDIQYFHFVSSLSEREMISSTINNMIKIHPPKIYLLVRGTFMILAIGRFDHLVTSNIDSEGKKYNHNQFCFRYAFNRLCLTDSHPS